ncbi:MAG: alkaline phosphatase family protein, partial [Candidatus Altarchaeaceae archaeon]
IKTFSLRDVKKDKITKIINGKNLDFIFLHVNISDIFGHIYGPNSKELKALHKYEDFFVRNIYTQLKSKYDVVNLIISSDHGMVEVTKHIDLWGELQNLPVRLKKDYIVFLDSPMARFWFFNEKAKNEIIKMLKKLDCGRILTEKDYEKYRIRFKDNRYGDLIWLANPGTLIFPNFFGWYKPVKGMHGYAPECEDNKGVFIIITDKDIKFEKRENLKMIDVFPTLCDIMNLPIPETCEGKSIVIKDG